jgi:hypothetical protein
MVWVPSRMEILVGQGNGSVVFWDSLKGNPVYVLKADFEEITQMCYDDATRRLVTTSKGKNIKVTVLGICSSGRYPSSGGTPRLWIARRRRRRYKGGLIML